MAFLLRYHTVIVGITIHIMYASKPMAAMVVMTQIHQSMHGRASKGLSSKWSHWGDLNSRPLDYESSAIPAKLQWQQSGDESFWDKQIGFSLKSLSLTIDWQSDLHWPRVLQ